MPDDKNPVTVLNWAPGELDQYREKIPPLVRNLLMRNYGVTGSFDKAVEYATEQLKAIIAERGLDKDKVSYFAEKAGVAFLEEIGKPRPIVRPGNVLGKTIADGLGKPLADDQGDK